MRRILNRLKNIYIKQAFTPSFMGIFINPAYFVRDGRYKKILSNKKYLKGKLLDFGCGKKPYSELFDVNEYVGLDIKKSGHSHDDEQIDIFYNGKTIPFNNNYFDSIFSSEVFEHIFNLDEIIKELYRVIKPGGYMLITLPFVWEEHEAPYDFARYTQFGIRYLLKKGGFKIIKIEQTTNYIETIFQMWNIYVYQNLIPNNRFAKLFLTPILIAPITVLGMTLSKLLPIDKKFYHNNIILVKK